MQNLAARGAMYATLKVRHDIHMRYVEDMLQTLESRGADVRVCRLCGQCQTLYGRWQEVYSQSLQRETVGRGNASFFKSK
jgi:hypothetical protein